ncbi:hypothetical protein IFM89_005186 [Coptis chinensis]|uniref:DUF4283 domain-containing protein n=1 Tax=Coptis chinensis TaxID=261450 RepID=A0A835M285_9MAGN|nr:hypothetical protein IFM89_005186 [Coptis chinensis]
MKGVTEWDEYVVGFFLERRLPFLTMRNLLRKRWNLKGDFEMVADEEIYYCKFSNDDDKKKTLVNQVYVNVESDDIVENQDTEQATEVQEADVVLAEELEVMVRSIIVDEAQHRDIIEQEEQELPLVAFREPMVHMSTEIAPYIKTIQEFTKGGDPLGHYSVEHNEYNNLDEEIRIGTLSGEEVSEEETIHFQDRISSPDEEFGCCVVVTKDEEFGCSYA